MRVFLVLGLLLTSTILSAYSAIAAYESDDGIIVGWAYDCSSQAEADSTAISGCRDHGGKNPKVELQSDGGWGALASGNDSDGDPVWGYCLGFDSRDAAVAAAIQQVKKAGAVSWKLEDAFLDTPSDAGDGQCPAEC